MKLLPSHNTASVTDYSSLSRNEISRFLSTLSEKKVYPATVVKMCKYLKFDAKMPIPLGDVQRVYLLGCAKELINGGRSNYNEVVNTCNLQNESPMSSLLEVWQLVHSMGGLSRSEFDEKLIAFYQNIQLDKH